MLTLLPEYEGKIDVIYIDPPYNTGRSDLIYEDHKVNSDDLFRHSKWASFIFARLTLAKKMLSESGLIFISIDDREHAHLKLLLDSIFGPDNFVNNFVWRTDGNFDNQAQIKSNHEYILCYAKNSRNVKMQNIVDPNVSESSKIYNEEIINSVIKNGPKNPISEILLPIGFPASFSEGVIKVRASSWPHYTEDILVRNWQTINAVKASSGWANAKMLKQFIDVNFVPIEDAKGQATKFRITSTGAIENVKTRSSGQNYIVSVLMNMGTTEKAGNELKKMGVNFSYPKPVSLIKYILQIASKSDAIILDFFAGSGTTAHAVAELNVETSGARKCILITDSGRSREEPDAIDIAEEITFKRLQRVLTGQNWADGKTHANLNQDLDMFNVDFVDTKAEIVTDWDEAGNPTSKAIETRDPISIIEELSKRSGLSFEEATALYNSWRKSMKEVL